ncbi:hypothetical protein J1N35_001138 [Gossypium stocksii]|uniref:Reverse transcriptase zinc-binding domain-containing protein n=1 Tax=Gossypium stocksii TaxID=47602 RepID=A0A9D3WII1_9ROSI|nr:hypothetical protein J1N35_001138 [Gossypium stocksii]
MKDSRPIALCNVQYKIVAKTKQVYSWLDESFAIETGKEAVIKAVAQSLSTFYMSVFLILLNTYDTLQKMMKSIGGVQSNHLSQFQEYGPWLKLWSGHVPPKVKDFVWPCMKNYVSTKARLHGKDLNVDNMYPRSVAVEPLDHVLILCSTGQAVWQLIRGMQLTVSLQ